MTRRLCHRYGPGRLPHAARRDVGGGIAMGATGLLATALWFLGAGLLLATGPQSGSLGFVFGLGLFFVPLAVPTSFVVGTVLWRTLYPDENRRLYGALFGGITALGSLAAGAIGPALFVAGSNVVGGDMTLVEATAFFVLLLPTGFLLALVAAGWLVLPLGIFGGWYHERAKATR